MSATPRDMERDMRHQTVPADTTSCDRAEIVEEIMDNLRPWTRRESEVKVDIQQTIESLRRANSPEFEDRFNRSAIKKSAQEFGAAIAKVEKALQRIHPMVAARVFVEMEGQPPHPTYKETLSAFQKKLGWMRWSCESTIRHPNGSHPNVDHAKKRCAKSAHELMRWFSRQTPTGTAERPFRTITSLLYQAVSGKRQDLKKACDEVVAKKEVTADGGSIMDRVAAIVGDLGAARGHGAVNDDVNSAYMAAVALLQELRRE
jgi:hypothetical protein